MLKSIIVKIFVTILSVLIIIASVLFYGIKVESFDSKFIKFEKLYVKLNKKLVVKISKLQINLTSTSVSSKDDLLKVISYLKALHILFEEIEIDNISLNNKSAKFKYNNQNFFLDNNFIKIDLKLQTQDNNISAKISQILLKDFNTSLHGRFSSNLKTHKSSLQAKFKFYNIMGEVNATRENNMLFYEASTQKFEGLDAIYNLLKSLNIGSMNLKKWLVDNIKSNDIKIDSIKGKVDFKNINFYLNDIVGIARAKDVKIYFVKDREIYAKSKHITIRLKKGTLQLFPKELKTSKGVAAYNSSAYIYNLFSKKIGLFLKLRANAMLSNHISNILKNFKIQLPFLQIDGNSEIALDMKMNFLPFSFEINGKILVQKANFILSKTIDFYTPYAEIIFADNIINFENMKIKNKYLGFIANIKYDITQQIMKGTIEDINSDIRINQNSLLKLDKLYSGINLNLKNGVDLNISKFLLLANFKKNGFNLKIPAHSLYQYSKLLQQYDLNDTSLQITSNNYKSFIFDIKDINQSIIPDVINLRVKVDINKNITKITTLNNRAKVVIDNFKTSINLQDIILNLTKLKIPKSTNSTSNSIDLKATNLSLLYKNLKLQNYNIVFTKNKYIQLKAKKDKHNISYTTAKNELSFVANIDSNDELNSIIGQDLFRGGKFRLVGNGVNENNISLNFSSGQTTIKGLSLFNNIMAFINTIPSLVTLKNPDFSSNGYKLKSIKSKMRYVDNILYFDETKLIGNSSDIVAKGWINLKTNKINLLLQVSFLDGLSRILKNIPLAGYLILGNDDKMSIGVKVKGSLSNPEISTQALKDIFTLPFRMIKRIFLAPFN